MGGRKKIDFKEDNKLGSFPILSYKKVGLPLSIQCHKGVS